MNGTARRSCRSRGEPRRPPRDRAADAAFREPEALFTRVDRCPTTRSRLANRTRSEIEETGRAGRTGAGGVHGLNRGGWRPRGRRLSRRHNDDGEDQRADECGSARNVSKHASPPGARFLSGGYRSSADGRPQIGAWPCRSPVFRGRFQIVLNRRPLVGAAHTLLMFPAASMYFSRPSQASVPPARTSPRRATRSARPSPIAKANIPVPRFPATPPGDRATGATARRRPASSSSDAIMVR